MSAFNEAGTFTNLWFSPCRRKESSTQPCLQQSRRLEAEGGVPSREALLLGQQLLLVTWHQVLTNPGVFHEYIDCRSTTCTGRALKTALVWGESVALFPGCQAADGRDNGSHCSFCGSKWCLCPSLFINSRVWACICYSTSSCATFLCANIKITNIH